ncbi:MAG: hypothetical protein JXB85_01550 [Anaerolineales bacterium]|nr:hypothetical protein [Anaerolineales bacterium]
MNDHELSIEKLRQLVSQTNQVSISLYLPTHPVGRASQQDRVHLKKLLTRAEADLGKLGYSPEKAVAILAPAQNLLTNRLFWQHQSRGLAVLLTQDDFQTYHLPQRCKELHVVSDTYHLKPLIPLALGEDRFYVLAIGLDDVRLFAGTQYDLDELEIPGKPAGLRDALPFNLPEKNLQFHTGTSRSAGQSDRPAVFHGHGAGTNDQKTNLLRYFRQVDASLKSMLRGGQNAPLVLACVDYLAPIYREANSYRHLLEETISGSSDRLRSASLQRKAWGIVAPHVFGGRKKAAARYRELSVRDSKKVSADIGGIVRAAYHGRVSVLFVALDEHVWGFFEPGQDRPVSHRRWMPGDRDLLDYAAVQTLRGHGTVYAVERAAIPAESSIAAIFRYPLRG